MQHRIFLVDDHPIVRAGYRAVLQGQKDIEICGEAGSAEEALDAIPDLHPDLATLDMALPGMNGIELVERLSTRGLRTRFLIVTGHEETLYAERAMKAGSHGYLMKHRAAEDFVDAVRRVLDGELYVSDALRERFLSGQLDQLGRSGSDRKAVTELTEREVELFEHFGRGLTTKAIADEVGLSVKTVESHRANIRRKLGIATGVEFVRKAALWAGRPLGSRQAVGPPGDATP